MNSPFVINGNSNSSGNFPVIQNTMGSMSNTDIENFFKQGVDNSNTPGHVHDPSTQGSTEYKKIKTQAVSSKFIHGSVGDDMVPADVNFDIDAYDAPLDLHRAALESGTLDDFKATSAALNGSVYTSLQQKMSDFPGMNSVPDNTMYRPPINPANPFVSLFNLKSKKEKKIQFEVNIAIPSKDLIEMLFDQNDSVDIKKSFLEYIDYIAATDVLQNAIKKSIIDWYGIDLSVHENSQENNTNEEETTNE